jgi:hypothetical protein
MICPVFHWFVDEDLKALGIGPSPLRRTWPEAQTSSLDSDLSEQGMAPPKNDHFDKKRMINH